MYVIKNNKTNLYLHIGSRPSLNVWVSNLNNSSTFITKELASYYITKNHPSINNLVILEVEISLK